MTARKTAPYGTWKSTITGDLIVGESVGLDMIAVDSSELYWLEIRPNENGRSVIVKRTKDGTISDVTPAGFHVGSRVHEYGGGAYVVDNGTVYFCNHADQRLYRQDLNSAPAALTPAPDQSSQLRFADMIVDRARRRIIAVCEEHANGSQPVNSLVSVPIDEAGEITTIASGNDFYSSPRLSHDGSTLAWLSWDHPNMPWDGTVLNVGECQFDGSVCNPIVIAGGINESIFQPQWSDRGDLVFVSDRTGWWNLYLYRDGNVEALCPLRAEFARPQWVFGLNTYAFESSYSLICSYNYGAVWRLGRLRLDDKLLTEIPSEYTDISWPKIIGKKLFFRGASPSKAPAIVALRLSTGQCEELRQSTSLRLDVSYISIPEKIEFPTNDGQRAHAFYYAPQNPSFIAPDEEKPPLLVKSHGGPTSSLSSALSLDTQFWTSRGFAVVDVNYGGSTGYGREYRERLYGKWGIVDVNDCVNAAIYLSTKGLADPERLLIVGRSASGFTALCALTFRDTFRCGTSYYGISDLEALAADTHKFELHSSNRLVGPYPERADIYVARSPIHHVDQIECPIAFFQGAEDKVVPVSQTMAMLEALKRKQIPVACLIFANEGHGFRRAETIKQVLESELSFYAQILGFQPADTIPLLAMEGTR